MVRAKVVLALLRVFQPQLISNDVAYERKVLGRHVFRGRFINSAAPLPIVHLYKDFRNYRDRFLHVGK